jgi:CheY-like chemotaxis protein
MSKKIIWIEDDTGIIRPVIRPLVNLGYKFITYANARDALDNLETIKTADLILLDMIHPPGAENNHFSNYPGLDFLKIIRNEHQLDIPVVVLTVVTNEDVHEGLKKLHVSDIINKPVRPSVLKEKVLRALGEE